MKKTFGDIHQKHNSYKVHAYPFIGYFSFFGTMFFVAAPKINIARQKING